MRVAGYEGHWPAPVNWGNPDDPRRANQTPTAAEEAHPDPTGIADVWRDEEWLALCVHEPGCLDERDCRALLRDDEYVAAEDRERDEA